MLKSCVGYSTNMDNILAGMETAKGAVKDLSNAKVGFLYTSEKNMSRVRAHSQDA